METPTDRTAPRPVADGGHTEVSLSDWPAVVAALETLEGEVTEDADRLVFERGSARLVVERAGTVEAGMPLHEFRCEGVASLAVDTDGGRVRVRGDGLVYEFRVPSGPGL